MTACARQSPPHVQIGYGCRGFPEATAADGDKLVIAGVTDFTVTTAADDAGKPERDDVETLVDTGAT